MYKPYQNRFLKENNINVEPQVFEDEQLNLVKALDGDYAAMTQDVAGLHKELDTIFDKLELYNKNKVTIQQGSDDNSTLLYAARLKFHDIIKQVTGM